MRILLFLFFFGLSFQALAKGSDSFIIQIQDRSMKVSSPIKKNNVLTVLIENRSLSDQVGKFMIKGKNLKFVSIPSGKNETIEIQNKEGATVYFVPLSPSFQEVELIFGKKVYEIPSKK
jgi:hypothetical protein